MDKEKLYTNTLRTLKSEDTLNEYELAKKIFKTERATSVQIRNSYEILDELLKKGLVNKKKLVKNSGTMDSGNVFETVDNRFSISLDGLTYLRSSTSKIQSWITNNQIIIKIIVSIIALGLTGIGLYMKYG